MGSKGRFGCAGSRFRLGLDFAVKGIVLQQRLGAFAHLPVRVSAATDFFKASMMLMTLLGAGAEAGAFALVFDGFFSAFFFSAMISSSRS